MDPIGLNRMEAQGPTRQTLQRILRDDRQIIANYCFLASRNVLKKQYGFDDERLQEFQEQVQQELENL